jgi:hypothetical protein
MFSCPGCNETMPREALTRLKVLHRHIAGAGPGPYDVRVLGRGNFYDASAVTTQLTITNCAVIAGDVIVIAVAASPNTTNANVTAGGLSCTQVLAGGGGDPDTDFFTRGTNTTGSKTVSITFALGQSAAAAVVIAVRGTKNTSTISDQTAGANNIGGQSTHFDSTAMPTPAASGEFLVGLVGVNGPTTRSLTKFGAGFAFIAREGTNQSAGAPPDIYMDVGWRVGGDLSAISFNGDLPTVSDWSCGIGSWLNRP